MIKKFIVVMFSLCIMILMFACTIIHKDGWEQKNGRWYYYKAGQPIKSGWINYEGEWYYFGQSGIMMHDVWINDVGNAYYLDSNGKMLKDTITPDGYHVDNAGRAIDKKVENYNNVETSKYNVYTEYIDNVAMLQFYYPNFMKNIKNGIGLFPIYEDEQNDGYIYTDESIKFPEHYSDEKIIATIIALHYKEYGFGSVYGFNRETQNGLSTLTFNYIDNNDGTQGYGKIIVYNKKSYMFMSHGNSKNKNQRFTENDAKYVIDNIKIIKY